MPDLDLLRGVAVGISISESPDLGNLGLGVGLPGDREPYLREATTEIALYLLRYGASLAYGGDLRPGGFTFALFELVRSYRNDAPEALPVANYLAWPVHRLMSDEQLQEVQTLFRGGGRLVLLDPEGTPIASPEARFEKVLAARQERLAAAPHSADDNAAWASGLSAMRRTMARDCSVRLLLGGKVQGYKGAYPGLAEEALLMLQARKPLFLAGGFGGCTRDVIAAIGGADGWRRRPPGETGPGYAEIMEHLALHAPEELRNGLSPDENRTLFETTSVPQIVKLVLAGLARLVRSGERADG
jgi:hypothetical protein